MRLRLKIIHNCITDSIIVIITASQPQRAQQGLPGQDDKLVERVDIHFSCLLPVMIYMLCNQDTFSS